MLTLYTQRRRTRGWILPLRVVERGTFLWAVLVLFEGTEIYLLRLDNGTAVQIKKDLIEGSRVREVTPIGTP
jgi:hypothetical protein